MLNHPICREGGELLREIDPDGTKDPEFFRRLFRRGQRLMKAGDDRLFGIGLLLIGIAQAADERRSDAV